MVMGRKPKYSRQLIEDNYPAMLAKAKKGGTKVQLAVILGVAKQTLYKWMEDHEEFSATIRDLMTISQGHWEEIKYKKSATNAPGSDVMIKFSMANMFRNDYATERTEATVQQDTRMDLQGAEQVLSGISIDDLKALLAQKEAETDDGK